MSEDPQDSITPQFTDPGEAWDRLESINPNERGDVIEELYTFGLRITTEAGDSIKAIEQKAINFAAYGTAVLSLLVTTASAWSKVGTSSSFVIASFAGLCGLLCAVRAVQALLLISFDTVSERDWLSSEHFGSIGEIKRFHTYALAQVLRSRVEAQGAKAENVESAQGWLAASAAYLALLLVQIAAANLCPGWYGRVFNLLRGETWPITRLTWGAGGWSFSLCCLLAALARICRSRWFRALRRHK